MITLKNGESYKVEELVQAQSERYFKHVIVDGVRLNIAMKTLEDGDFLTVIGPLPPKKLFTHYKFRWGIETFFQSIKGRGRFAAAIKF